MTRRKTKHIKQTKKERIEYRKNKKIVNSYRDKLEIMIEEYPEQADALSGMEGVLTRLLANRRYKQIKLFTKQLDKIEMRYPMMVQDDELL